MRHSEFDIQNPMDDGKPEVPWPWTPEERVDRYGALEAFGEISHASRLAQALVFQFHQIPQCK